MPHQLPHSFPTRRSSGLPRAPTPSKRSAAIRTLSAAGVPTAVMAAPMIPALNDSEMERILAAAAGAGATSAGYVLLRLPLEIKDLFQEWLEIGRAHVRTPVTNAHLVCRLLLEKKKNNNTTSL